MFYILITGLGLLTGILFAFLLKKSRFCPTGTIRDIYVEKNYYNITLILSVIFTQSLFYYAMVYFGVLDRPFFDSFSLLGVAVGSLIFGFGAVLSNGCAAASLLKTGDGRIVGIASVITFAIAAYVADKGIFKIINKNISGVGIARDRLLKILPISPFFICIAIVPILYFIMYRHYKKHKPKYKLPSSYSGIRHILFEKIWSKELAVILIGLLMASAFYSSILIGREGGFAISTPIISWLTYITGLPAVAGG